MVPWQMRMGRGGSSHGESLGDQVVRQALGGCLVGVWGGGQSFSSGLLAAAL